jgi:hypothetical protein
MTRSVRRVGWPRYGADCPARLAVSSAIAPPPAPLAVSFPQSSERYTGTGSDKLEPFIWRDTLCPSNCGGLIYPARWPAAGATESDGAGRDMLRPRGGPGGQAARSLAGLCPAAGGKGPAGGPYGRAISTLRLLGRVCQATTMYLCELCSSVTEAL